MSVKIPTNIEELFINQLNSNPIEIIQRINDDLEKFLKEIIEDESEYVLICGRKSNLLYNKYIADIASSDKKVLNIENLGDTTIGFFGRGKTLLLSDSVHNGDEFSGIHSFLLQNVGTNVLKQLKVCTYIGFKSGLDYIKSMNVDCKAHHYYDDPKKYSDHMKNLDIYFQSKHEHLETDVPYDRYNIYSSDFVYSDLIIQESLNEMICDDIEIQKNNLYTISNVTQYSINCSYDFKNCGCLNDIYIIKKLKDIDAFVHRFIVKIVSDGRKIIITSKSDPFINFSTYGIHKKITLKCRLNYINHKQCNHLKVNFDKRKTSLKQYICATCVGNSISELILDKFKNILTDKLRITDIPYEVTRISNKIII